MSEYGPTYNEIDGYIAELTEAEREELATADAAIELAFLFHDARQMRGLTQAQAAQRAGLRQQAVSRFEQPDMKLANTKIETLRRYLAALGYSVQITLRDLESGRAMVRVSLPPQQASTYTEMAPLVEWGRGQAGARTVVGAGEANPPNAYWPPPFRYKSRIKFFPGKGNTDKLLDWWINPSDRTQEPTKTYA